jgi:hypothetical protein
VLLLGTAGHLKLGAETLHEAEIWVSVDGSVLSHRCTNYCRPLANTDSLIDFFSSSSFFSFLTL